MVVKGDEGYGVIGTIIAGIVGALVGGFILGALPGEDWTTGIILQGQSASSGVSASAETQ
jgi:uncharacterized membrane protein YeaQ/YmgE (transglycosylase-associated protein family)